MVGLDSIHDVPHERAEEVVAVLCDSFHDYPVMRHVIGDAADDYDARLSALIGLFVSARVLHQHPIIAASEGKQLVAVATMTPPGHHKTPAEFVNQRERVWRMLGDEARERYDLLTAIWQKVGVTEPNLHLNMIGVRRSHAGAGLGRMLLDRVHDMSRSYRTSTGVSLTTEDPHNVTLYRYFGYDVVAHQHITEGLETWGFFRRNRP